MLTAGKHPELALESGLPAGLMHGLGMRERHLAIGVSMDEQHRSFDVGDDLRWTHSGEIDTRPPPYGEKKRIPQHPVAAARAQQAAGRIPKISKRSIERKGGQLIVGRGRIERPGIGSM